MNKQRYLQLVMGVLLCVMSVVVPPARVSANNADVVIQTPRSGGVNITWSPPATDHNLELLFVVASGKTPTLTVLAQTQTIDTNNLPIVDDHAGLTNSAVKLGQIVQARGQSLVGIIIQPRFYDALGIPQRLTQVSFNVSDVTYISDVQSLTNARPFLRQGIAPRQYQANEWRVVAGSGWQRIRGSDLIAAGLPVRNRFLNKLELHRGNQLIPLLLTGLDDARIDTADEIVFFAPPVTSRWQATQTMWLRFGNGAGRIATRVIPPVKVTATTTAWEIAQVRQPNLYEPTVAGQNGEYWFSQRLRLDASMESESITLQPSWKAPVARGAQVRATVQGHAQEDTAGPHVLSLNGVTTTWEGVGAWQQTLEDRGTSSVLALRSDGISEILIDSVEYARSASIIVNVPYEIATPGWYRPSVAVNSTHRVFDITNPLAPVLIRNAFQPGLFDTTEVNRRVMILAPNNYSVARITRLVNPVWSTTGADAVYIAPAALLPALKPLIDYRNSQGVATVAIDVQTIYDGWNNGDMSPQAIRSFLQFVAHRWQKVPHTVVLVGDGTVDPLNYTKSGVANVNHIPPYLAEVDSYMGESACESCFVRLDGTNPLNDAAPDMVIGRISVRTATELTDYINKVKRYEAQPIIRWTNQHVIASDNPDSGGDFPYFAQMIQRSAHLSGLRAQLYFYDPLSTSKYTGPRIQSATTLRTQFLQAINTGAGLVTYIGHANHYQWASTDFLVSQPYLMNIWDVDGLTNGNMTPIMVSMACLSSAFQRESSIGQTIDERLVFKSSGGAIATWGSAGMEVASGHNQMFYNFYRVLRDGNQPLRTLGAATFVGSVYLAASSTCCANVISAYTLIGDPLVRPRITTTTGRSGEFVDDEIGARPEVTPEQTDGAVVDVQLVDQRLLPTPAALPPQP
ncbi:MAG: hypothetical protein FJ040_01450 [Chloroflexi bacterium]|nr:hypothetical protein [Chloroflexota bacterium]